MSTTSGSCKSVGGGVGTRRRLDRDVDVTRTEAAYREPLRPQRAGIPVDDDVVRDDRRVAAVPRDAAKRIVPAMEPVGASTVMRPPVCATIRATTNGSPRSLNP